MKRGRASDVTTWKCLIIGRRSSDLYGFSSFQPNASSRGPTIPRYTNQDPVPAVHARWSVLPGICDQPNSGEIRKILGKPQTTRIEAAVLSPTLHQCHNPACQNGHCTIIPQQKSTSAKRGVAWQHPTAQGNNKDSGARRQCDLDPRQSRVRTHTPPTSNRAGLLSRARRRVCGDVRSPQPCRSSQANQNQPMPKSPPNHDPSYPPPRPQTPPTSSSHLHHAQKCNGERGSRF